MGSVRQSMTAIALLDSHTGKLGKCAPVGDSAIALLVLHTGDLNGKYAPKGECYSSCISYR